MNSQAAFLNEGAALIQALRTDRAGWTGSENPSAASDEDAAWATGTTILKAARVGYSLRYVFLVIAICVFALAVAGSISLAQKYAKG